MQSAHNTSSYVAAERCRPCCGQQMVIMRALLFVSLLSFAICFPSDYITIPKSYLKEKVESRTSFRQNPHASSFQHVFLPDVFVLSLSSTSQSPFSDLDRDTINNKRKTNRKSTKITVKAVDSTGQELPLRTIEYRRRKHEWAERYTSQEGLREAFGSNRNRLWGDLDAKTARRLYKRLLFPTALSELVLELGDEIVRPEELAPLAYEARKAAKMYARERCRVPSRVGAYLFDGFRQLRKYGRFQPNGASYEQIWIRYYEENGNQHKPDNEWEYLFGQDDDVDDDDDVGDIIDGIDDAVTEEEIVKRTCQKILEKSCTTNEAIDRFYLKEYHINATMKGDNGIDTVDNIEKHSNYDDDGTAENEDRIANGKIGRGKRWRNRKKRKDLYNDLLLERITKTLERDVRKLLEQPPSSFSSSVSHGEAEVIDSNSDETRNQCVRRRSNIRNINSIRKEGSLSSRRMTQQEYHSLKLFAKARKYSQHHPGKDNNLSDSTRRSPSTKNSASSESKSVSVPSSFAITDRKTLQDERE